MLIAFNRLRHRHRRHLALIAASVALCGAVAVAHTVMVDHGMGPAMTACIAVMQTAAVGAAAMLASAMVGGTLGLPAMRLAAPAPISLLGPAPAPRSRAGPPRLQVFRL